MGNLRPMGAKLLGAHMPTSGGLDKAVRNGKAIGCVALQVFTSSPQQWRAKDVSSDMAEAFQAALKETGIGPVVSHDSYLINLSSADAGHREKSIKGLTAEMERAAKYGIPYVVSHIGAKVGQPEEEVFAKAAAGIKAVLADSTEAVTLLMETTAGQGSTLNSKFEELARLLEMAGNPGRLGVCLDTCHVFAAGYDLRTKEAYESTMAEFDRVVGMGKLKVIHCNDSKKGLGSKVDRHEHIGEGCIGPEGFRALVNDPRFEWTPILLETPDAPEGHERNLKTLRGYIA